MSETRITDNGTDVLYRMPPHIAEELANVLNYAAIHDRDGNLRQVKKYDQGWLLDAESLREAAANTDEEKL